MLDPETYATRTNTEHAHQVAVFMWAALPEQQKAYPELRYMFAIPNGGKRDKITAANLKAEGVKPGVPDIFLPIPKGPWHGLFIEMKKTKDYVISEDQLKWSKYLFEADYCDLYCFSFAEAKRNIIEYMNLK